MRMGSSSASSAPQAASKSARPSLRGVGTNHRLCAPPPVARRVAGARAPRRRVPHARCRRLRPRRRRAWESGVGARGRVRVRARARPRVHLSRGRGRRRAVGARGGPRCGAHRIGHATRLIEDEAAHAVRERPSDSRSRSASRATCRRAPSRRTTRTRCGGTSIAGLNVVLNTDNRLMSGTTLTDEYVHAARTSASRSTSWPRVALNGFASAFLPWAERARMLADATPRSRDCARARTRDDADAGRRGGPPRRGRFARASATWRRSPRSCSAPASAASPTRSTTPVAIPYATIPGFPTATVAGHAGRADRGHARGVPGARARPGDSICTKATTRRSPRFRCASSTRSGHGRSSSPTPPVESTRAGNPGDLMLIRDHINLMFRNPLIGPLEQGDLRFPDMSVAVRRRGSPTSRSERGARAGDRAARKASTRGCSARSTRPPPKCACWTCSAPTPSACRPFPR